MMMPDVAFWKDELAAYGWAASPLLFNVQDDLVTDDPVTAALDAAATRSLSVGIPHPQYGMMRATAYVTEARTLTRLSSIAHAVAAAQFAASRGMPHLYVGRSPLVDRVDGRECVVLGVLVFGGPAGGADVQCAPLTAVKWEGRWLPLFEDANDWLMTGWDSCGTAAHIFKPFGWGCPALVLGADHHSTSNEARRVSTAESRASDLDSAAESS